MLRKEVMESEIPVEKPQESEAEPLDTEKEAVECPVNFTKLQGENPDIFAWIQIPGTRIDYPVLCRLGKLSVRIQQCH